ncbi:hypothetical protein GUJ93_ZPchr0010g9645 [Zizania palustris]|uniref:PS II complex 12 kDa extrinsic protein n=1 Tax=Zizania palustris TaxID=103762 RepID=A0A8J6BMH0_ZIZPA|nr:hypothetical protein GUJ93_ZPchr0010g9645 [Zizania palustris]
MTMLALVASLLSPSPLLTTATPFSTSQQPEPPQAVRVPTAKSLATTLAAVAAAGLLVLSPAVAAPSSADPEFTVYYGTAASVANYGRYGGNASKKDVAEYVYEVPEGWKERLVSKVEKGTNGTDSEFFNNPSKRSEREYLTFFAGFRALAPVSAVLDNLALSNVVGLQDHIYHVGGRCCQQPATQFTLNTIARTQ